MPTQGETISISQNSNKIDRNIKKHGFENIEFDQCSTSIQRAANLKNGSHSLFE